MTWSRKTVSGAACLATMVIALSACDAAKTRGGLVPGVPAGGGGAADGAVKGALARGFWDLDLGEREVPVVPAAGRLKGRPFKVERSQIREGVLRLEQGDRFNLKLQVTIFLFLEKGEVPAGRTWRIAAAKGHQRSRPHVHFTWRPGGQGGGLHTDSMVDGYALILSFGKERKGRLPGRLWLCLPDSERSWVAGTFTARIEGFRLVDGRPDLASDSFETLKVVGKRYLAQRHRPKGVEVLETGQTRFTHPGSKPQTGLLEIAYRVAGEAEPHTVKLLFKKTREWHVAASLAPHQIPAAHPLYPPKSGDPPHERIQLAAARWLEADLQARFPDAAIQDAMVNLLGRNDSIASCSTTYRVAGHEGRVRRRLALRLVSGSWEVTGEIGPGQSLDFKTGSITRSN